MALLAQPTSVLNLLAVYARLPHLPKELKAYDHSAATVRLADAPSNPVKTAANESRKSLADLTAGGLGEIGPMPTGSSLPADSGDLLQPRQKDRGRGGER